jgi:hypothetical protein
MLSKKSPAPRRPATIQPLALDFGIDLARLRLALNQSCVDHPLKILFRHHRSTEPQAANDAPVDGWRQQQVRKDVKIERICSNQSTSKLSRILRPTLKALDYIAQETGSRALKGAPLRATGIDRSARPSNRAFMPRMERSALANNGRTNQMDGADGTVWRNLRLTTSPIQRFLARVASSHLPLLQSGIGSLARTHCNCDRMFPDIG